MIVVDTNVIAYLYFEGHNSKLISNLLERDASWHAPILWRSEFRNVLAFYYRKNLISSKHMLKTMEQAESLMENGEHFVSSEDVLKLVHKSTCSAYDCEFVALAQNLDVPLVTFDKKIINSFPKIAVAL